MLPPITQSLWYPHHALPHSPFFAVWAYQNYALDAKCYSTNPSHSVLTAVLLYGSYFVLFLKFYIDRWMDNKRKAREAKNAEVKALEEKENGKEGNTSTSPRGRKPKEE